MNKPQINSIYNYYRKFKLHKELRNAIKYVFRIVWFLHHSFSFGSIVTVARHPDHNLFHENSHYDFEVGPARTVNSKLYDVILV